MVPTEKVEMVKPGSKLTVLANPSPVPAVTAEPTPAWTEAGANRPAAAPPRGGDRTRLDAALVAAGLVATRSRARDLILRGLVRLDGVVASKPGALVRPGADLSLDAAARPETVSRGAVKLAAALDAFGFDPRGRVALDVGASTGGFTQELLVRGAAKVYAVDVGHGQLSACLAADPRVVNLEGHDARGLSPALIPEPITALVADVSFIGLAKALPAALALCVPGAFAVLLVKPQFEAGRAALSRRGIVREASARTESVARVAAWLGGEPGWRIVGEIVSPVLGGSGNQEFLIGARLDG